MMSKSANRLQIMVDAAIAIELKGRSLFSATASGEGIEISHSTKCGQGKISVSWYWGADIELRIKDYIDTL